MASPLGTLSAPRGARYSRGMSRPDQSPDPQPVAQETTAVPVRIAIPESAALVVGIRSTVWLSSDGELESLEPAEAATRARRRPPLLCHGPTVARRLGIERFAALDLLELYAFVRPASFVAPTVRSLAAALGLAEPTSLEQQAAALPQAAARLLGELAAGSASRDPRCAGIAWAMARAAWPWGPAVLGALGLGEEAAGDTVGTKALAIWSALPAWEDHPPEAAAGNQSVSDGEARDRLAALLDAEAEARPQQADYASALSQAFLPRAAPGEPGLVLAEAGTGVGKTLGYIAPASLWAEKSKAPVWISTYTRNLQQQIDAELDRLYPEPRQKAERVVLRKGRENYLCLLNYQQLIAGLQARPQDAVAAGLLARWALASRDGDLVGGDLPGWLPDLVGRGRLAGLTDRRGECIHSACEHYRRCFIERTIRRARHADLVVANHALVMVQAAMGGGAGADGEGRLPQRYVFDEGHHLFNAADSAFAMHLSGQETHELRRWLRGSEAGGRSASRIRGLKRRIEDLVAADEAASAALAEGLAAARALPSDGWRQRLTDGTPQAPAEAFLALVSQQVYARSEQPKSPYSLETEAKPPIDGLHDKAAELAEALERLLRPLKTLHARLAGRLEDDAEELDSDLRRRIEGACRSLKRRALWPLDAWRQMLEALEADTPEPFVDWFAVERVQGRDRDVGFFRHWKDPTEPFAETVLAQAHGVAVTSATLTDGSGAAETDWAGAEMRSGAAHLPVTPYRARVPSPFDYAAQTRVLIVTDVRKDDLGQVAAAYRALFEAAAGGGLGLFTAISRLRGVHERIAAPLEAAGLPLYAQHVDPMDVATLVDIFRAEPDSCLLGTDALRDGVDVPGAALRLIVFDRVPWPRPDIRHRARREIFGGRRYDDQLARLRIKQAYGRLIRRADDHGVFVLLDPMTPSRLLTALPEGVEPQRIGLAEAVAEVRDFLATTR